MPVIDADGHVMEWAGTFDDRYFDDARFRDQKPQVIDAGGRKAWLIEDQILPRWRGRGVNSIGTPTGAYPYQRLKWEEPENLELRDIHLRWAQLQEEGIDLQVVYPTLFLVQPLCTNPGLAAALCRSYNNWMSDVCSQMPDRFKWAAVVSLADVPSAVAEVRRARTELGAVAIMTLGTAGDRFLHDPSFWPFFEELAAQDTTLAVHVGRSMPLLSNLFDHHFYSAAIAFTFPLLMAYTSILGSGVFDDFSNLRVAFLEAGSEWLHFMTGRLDHFYEGGERLPLLRPRAKRKPSDYLKSGNVYITCEVDDTLLPQAVELIGEDHIIYDSDIPHRDRHPYSAALLRERADLSEGAKQKILYANARQLYRI